MALTKVLITVKTYPTISDKYDELVCTAGFREDGTWVRIYPVTFRSRPYSEQYKKYDWIEVDLERNTSDFRPSSYRPKRLDTVINVVGHIGTENNWEERKKLCLGNVYHNLNTLIAEANDKELYTSLAVFKPTEILEFTAEPVAREWDKNKLERMNQLKLFETDSRGQSAVVKKLPYKFKLHFKDDEGRISRLMIEDWETGQLYWNCLARHEGDEAKAIADVQKKYFDDFAKTKDLHFFLGTTLAHHVRSPNPFIIIGTFHPKNDTQIKLI